MHMLSTCRPPHLDLLAVGSDTPLLLQLLVYGSSLAQRSLLHCSVADLWGCGRKEAATIFVDGEKSLRSKKSLSMAQISRY